MLQEVELIASGLKFPRHPIAMPDGGVLITESKRGTLTKVFPDGRINVIAECGGAPNGIAIGPDGRVYICNRTELDWEELSPGIIIPDQRMPKTSSGGSIQALDMETGEIETIYKDCHGHPLMTPNSLVFDQDGNFWFTDGGRRRIYYASIDGKLIKEKVWPTCPIGGIGLSPDGKYLYYAESVTARLFRRDITGPGVLGEADYWYGGYFAGSSYFCYFASLAVDGKGNICIGTEGPNNGITVISPDGSKVELVQLPPEFQDKVTLDISFGGQNLSTAFITCSSTGRLVSCRWPQAEIE